MIDINRPPDLITLDDCWDEIKAQYNGKSNPSLDTGWKGADDYFRWLSGEITAIGGVGNHGKSTWIRFMCLLASIKHNFSWCYFGPEDYPPEYFYKDIMHMKAGKSTETYHKNCMTFDEIESMREFIGSKFKYVYPEFDSATPDLILERFEQFRQYGCNGFVIDPFNQLDHDWNKNGRDDRYISNFIDKFKKWTRDNKVHTVITVHPNKSVSRRKDSMDYQCPDVFEMAGGAMWSNKMDNIIFVHRPLKTSDPDCTDVEIRYAKIKKKYVGRPGQVTCSFDRMTNRYSFLGDDGFNDTDNSDILIGKDGEMPF